MFLERQHKFPFDLQYLSINISTPALLISVWNTYLRRIFNSVAREHNSLIQCISNIYCECMFNSNCKEHAVTTKHVQFKL